MLRVLSVFANVQLNRARVFTISEFCIGCIGPQATARGRSESTARAQHTGVRCIFVDNPFQLEPSS
jgi:hypothetical protein